MKIREFKVRHLRNFKELRTIRFDEELPGRYAQYPSSSGRLRR